MKISIENIPLSSEEQIVIRCWEVDEQIKGIVRYVKSNEQVLLGYEAFFQPLIYGLICLVPGFLTYSSKELTKKQYVIRKVYSFIGIEALLYVIIVKSGAMSKVMDMLLFFVAVGIVYAAVHLFSWLVLQKIKQLQKKTGNQ